MARYIIRVVLHDNASFQDYQLLHANLAARGVHDDIVGDDGRWYRLPPAEYRYEGAEGLPDVRDAVTLIAEAIKRCSVLVTESLGRAWANLEEISAPTR